MPPKSTKQKTTESVPAANEVLANVKSVVNNEVLANVKPMPEANNEVSDVISVSETVNEVSTDENKSWRNNTTNQLEQTTQFEHVNTQNVNTKSATRSITTSVLEYDQDFYRHLDKTNLNQYTIDDLLRVLSVRGYDNKNPALWAGARRLMQQLSCEQIENDKTSKKVPPPYIRNAPFREQRHEIQKEKRQEVYEQRQQLKEKRNYNNDNVEQHSKFPHNTSTYDNPKFHRNTPVHDDADTQKFHRNVSNDNSRFPRNKSKYNRNFDETI